MDKQETLFRLHAHLGCLAEAKIYNPQEKSLCSRSVNGYFIDYPQWSRGYSFYYLTRTTRIVEIDRANFLEDDCVSGSILRDYVFEESQEDIIVPN